jgi:hypothetical protein
MKLNDRFSPDNDDDSDKLCLVDMLAHSGLKIGRMKMTTKLVDGEIKPDKVYDVEGNETSLVRLTKQMSINATESWVAAGHWAEGYLCYPVTVGKMIMMIRVANSSHPDGFWGLFNTSTVKRIDQKDGYQLIRTENSIYKLEEVK